MSATKLHGPDTGLSYREATQPTKAVAAEAELPGSGPLGGGATTDAAAAAPRPKAALESYLSRREESCDTAPAVQVGVRAVHLCRQLASGRAIPSTALPCAPAAPQAATRQRLECATAQPEVQQAAKQTLQEESQSLGQAEDAAGRSANKRMPRCRRCLAGHVGQRCLCQCLPACRGLEQQAEDVLRLRGGMQPSAAPDPPAPPVVLTAGGQAHAPVHMPAAPTLADGEPVAAAYQSPHTRGVAAVEQASVVEGTSGRFCRRGSASASCCFLLPPHFTPVSCSPPPPQEFQAVEAPLFGRVQAELGEAVEAARVAELKTGEAVQVGGWVGGAAAAVGAGAG